MVMRVGSEPAPPELIAIPLGARRVESKPEARDRILKELDSLTPRGPTP
jgi:hypothetical protein